MRLDRYSYVPGGFLLKSLTGLYLVNLVLAGVSFLFMQSQIELLNRVETAQQKYADLDSQIFIDDENNEARFRERDELYAKLTKETEASDQQSSQLGALQIVATLSAIVLFFKLLSRANRNVRAMGALNLKFTPGWCIGWFFIPFANLFKPFQAVRETWRASIVCDGHWENNPSSPLLGLWWTLWLINGALGQVVFRMTMNADTLQAMQSVNSISLVSDVVNIVSIVVSLLMIRRLYSLQDEKYAEAGEQTDDSSLGSSCRFCGEPIDVMVGNCPMCGEPLAAFPDRSQARDAQW